MAFLGIFRRKPFERAGFTLYASAVAAARDPWFYTALGVPDTLDGRFDLVGLHAAMLIHRLQGPAPGPDLAQGVFDGMFSDMDHNLREIGVGDMTVGKRVRAMWEAFHGRAQAYAAALDADDAEALAAALARNVWRGAHTDDRARTLAAYALRQYRALQAQDLGNLAQGEVRFDPAFA